MGAARTSSPTAVNTLVVDDSSRQQELERLRMTLGRLRDPAGAVRLAVQMLAGPLRAALSHAPPETGRRVAEVLEALEASSAELSGLLTPCRTPVAQIEFAAAPLPPASAHPRARAVDDLFDRVVAQVAQRCPLKADVRVQVPRGLTTLAPAQDLQMALCGLLQNSIEASARKRPDADTWRVELRAFVAPAEELGDELHAVFEVRDRGDGVPPAVVLWAEDPTATTPANDIGGPGLSLRLARRLCEVGGGRLSIARISGSTRVALHLPHADPADGG